MKGNPKARAAAGLGEVWNFAQNCPQEVRPEMTWQAFLRHAIQTQKEYCSSIWFYYDFMP